MAQPSSETRSKNATDGSPSSSAATDTPSPPSIPRSVIRQFAHWATRHPIEVIVTIFIIVTFAYFQLLHAVTHSDFFEPLNQDAARMAAAYRQPGRQKQSGSGSVTVFDGPEATILIRKAGSGSQWRSISDLQQQESIAVDALSFEVESVILTDSETSSASLDTSGQPLKEKFLPAVADKLYDELSRNCTELSVPVQVYDSTTDLTAFAFGRVFRDGENVSSRKTLLEDAGDSDLLASVLRDASRAVAHDLRRSPGGAKEAKALDDRARYLSLLSVISDRDLERHTPGGRRSSGATEELRSVRWLAYTMRALVIRFWALLQKADSADIFVMLVAYVMMHGTFINLFLSMRKFGSNFWLGELTRRCCRRSCGKNSN